MDFSKVKTPDWMIIGGGLGMLIFGLLDWMKIGGISLGANAFDFFFTGTVPWIVLIAAAVITFLRTQDKMSDSLPWPMITVYATALMTLLLLIRLIFNPGVPSEISVTYAMILSLISGGVATGGAVMAFQAGGASIGDLANVDKVKAGFAKDDKPAVATPTAESAPEAPTPTDPVPDADPEPTADD